jgi:Tfp pilus assembly pilus retraction ATPase PilT
MYTINDLLKTALAEQCDAVRIQVGQPPDFKRRDTNITVEGPPVTAFEADQLLLEISNSRYRRDLREKGSVKFFYLFQNKTRFLVYACLDNDGNVMLELS